MQRGVGGREKQRWQKGHCSSHPDACENPNTPITRYPSNKHLCHPEVRKVVTGTYILLKAGLEMKALAQRVLATDDDDGVQNPAQV